MGTPMGDAQHEGLGQQLAATWARTVEAFVGYRRAMEAAERRIGDQGAKQRAAAAREAEARLHEIGRHVGLMRIEDRDFPGARAVGERGRSIRSARGPQLHGP